MTTPPPPVGRSLRWLRWLPAVVILGGVLALVVPPLLRGRATWQREADRLEASLCVEAERARMVEEARALLRRHRGADVRWYVADLFARAHDLGAAVETLTETDDLLGAPGGPKRLARSFLEALSTPVCGRPEEAGPRFPRAIQARIEAGDPAALRALEAVVAQVDAASVVALYAPVHRTVTVAQERFAAALRRRADVPELAAAGTVLAARPGDHGTAEALQGWIASDWRKTRPFFFQHLTRALGTVGGAQHHAFLRARRAVEEAEGDEGRRRLALDVGLALCGDDEAYARVLQAIEARPLDVWAAHRLALGWTATLMTSPDPDTQREARSRLVSLWDAVPDRETRLTIAMGVLLSDRLPPADTPADAWAEALRTHPERVARVVPLAWALRKGRPGAARRLADEVVDLVRAHPKTVVHPESTDDDAATAFMEALRALLRWG